MQQTCSLHVGNHLQTETGYFYFYLFKKKNKKLLLALQSQCS